MKRRDPFYPRPRQLSAGRKRIELLATGGIGALAVAMCMAPPGWGATGSFQGSVATSVNANISTTATTTDVDIYGSRAIIEWNPSDADINASAAVDFQPIGTTATFSSSSLTDFTVLNVINAPGSRVIALNGAVQSKVSDGQNGMTTGGTVWFYSRNGFLVGSKASFDVGSLLLTANRPEGAYDPKSQDGYNHEFDNQVQTFSVEAGRSGTITISPGAQINASNYVALIAPHIVQGGAVRANGEIAYVGAESVDMSLPLNGGLFNIAITTGTDGVGITHTGSTGGPASSASDQKRNIYMVTVPKNDAVTMLISGSIGYDTVQSATTLSDGTLLLAGGDTTIDSGTFIPTSKADLPGTIKISDASFSNNVTAIASHLTVDAAQADLTFAGNATLRGVYDATMTIAAGRTATVGGDLSLQGWGLTDPDTGSQEGGTASLTIGSGATLALKGALTIDASGQGFSTLGQAVEQQNGSAGTGGTATLTLNDGAINGGKDSNGTLSAGSILVTASATGGNGNSGGGDGNAGNASIVMNGGSILASTVTASADGLGGGSESSDAASGAGHGGTAMINLLRGTATSPSLTASQSIIASATGSGGTGTCYYCYEGSALNDAAGAKGGAGLGGIAQVTMAAGAISTPQLLAIASGQGGAGMIGAGPSQGKGQQGYSNGGDGGSGTGGSALIDLSGGTANIGDSSVFAAAEGGIGGDAVIGEGGQSSDTGNAGNGGAAIGGDARIQIAGTNVLFSGQGAGSFSIHTSAVGGNGGSSSRENSGNGGTASHGANRVARLQVGTGASVQLGRLTIDATAAGGDGGDYTNDGAANAGGSATGGAIEIAQTGGSLSFATSSLVAGALRGIGGNRGDNVRGTAGNATGGSILAQTSGGTLTLGTLTLADVSGMGTQTEGETTLLEAGAGQGGSISFKASGTGILSASEASLSAAGYGGNGSIDAANGKAGQILIQAQDSSRINFTGTQIVADASATGGNNGQGVNVGGMATGGSIRIEADDTATITLPTSANLLLGATGGGNAAIGGQGTAGLAQLTAAGGTIDGAALSIKAAGSGGDANSSGSGGNIQFASSGDLHFTGTVSADVSGIGSTGAGIGGLIGLTTSGGKGLTFGATTLSADATGNSASAGGITITASTGAISLASLDAHALGDASVAERIAVKGLGAAVHVLGDAQLRTSSNLSLAASDSGGIIVDGNLTVVTPGAVSLSHSQPLGTTLSAATAAFTVGTFASSAGSSVNARSSLSINATGTIDLVSATAGDIVSLTGTQGVTVGGVLSSGAAVAGQTGALDPNHAFVSITAGDATHSADVTINQEATAAGTVAVNATGTITVAGNANVYSGNVTRLVAGNDIAIRSGAIVTAAALPLNATSGSLSLTAGGGQTPPPGVHSLIIAGSLNAFAAPITLSADAIQATGAIQGGSLNATLAKVPAVGAPADNDGGQLSAGCTAGAICLGNVTLGGIFNVGTAATVTLAGNVSASSISANSRDKITLGNAQTATTIAASGSTASLSVGSGSIVSAGNTTLTAKTDILLSAATVNAPQLSAQAGGNLLFSNGGAITLLDAIAGGQIASNDSSLSPVSIGGAFTALGTLQAGAGAIDINAAGISINRLKAANGVTLHLASGNGADVSVTDASASSAGTLANTTISGRAITIGKLGSAGTVGLNGSGAVQVTTDLAATGAVSAQGASVSIRSLGALTFASLTSTSGDIGVNASGALSVPGATSAGALSLTSGGNLTANTLSAQTTLGLTAAGLLQVNTNLIAGGAISVQGGNVALTLANATTIASGVATAGDLVIHDGGALSLTSASATGGVDLTGSGITIGTVSAGGLFKAVATGGLGFASVSGGTVQLTAQSGAQGNAITGGTLTSTGAATLLAGDAVTVSTDFAVGAGSKVDGSSVSLTSIVALAPAHIGATGGGIILRSGGDLTLTDARATGSIDIRSTNGLINATGLIAGSTGVTARGTSVTLGSAGALTVASATATAGDFAVTTGANLAVTSGSATGAIRLISTNGAVTFNALSIGSDLLIHAHDDVSLGALALPGSLDLASSAGAINVGPVTAGGNVTAKAATNLVFTNISGSTLNLTATGGILTGNRINAGNGATLVADTGLKVDTDVAVTGPLSATGANVALTATGALAPTNVIATNGGITLRSGGALTLTQASATGTIDIQSSGGTVNASGFTAGNGVIARGTAVTLGSTGALTVASATATAGDLIVDTIGNLTVNSGSASGAIRLTSASGSLATTTLTPGSDLLLHSANDLAIGNLAITGAIDLASTTGAITAGTIGAGGDIKAVAATNLGFATVSGNSLTLTATSGTLTGSGITAAGAATLNAGGALTISNGVTVAGQFDVTGRSIALTTPGALTVYNAIATGGDLVIHDSGPLTLTSASATGGVDLTGSGITIGTVSAGGLLKAVATGGLGFTSIGGGTVQLTAQGGAQGNAITGGTLTSTGVATLRASDAIMVGTNFATGAGSSVDGRSVSLTGIGALALAHVGATGGDITLRSGGDLALTDASASGGIDIQSSNGLINATGLIAGAAGVTARGTAVTLGSTGALTVASATATAGDLVVTAGGDLVVNSGSATGVVRLISNNGGLTFTTLSSGTDLLVHAHDDLALGNLAVTGTVDLASSNGTIAAGQVTAGGTLTAKAATNLRFTNLSGTTLNLAATSGTITGNRIAATNGATVIAGGALNIDTNASVAGPFNVTGGSIAITTTGPLSLTSATATNGAITLRSANDLALALGNATGAIDIQSSGGAVTASNLSTGIAGVTARGTAVTLGSTGALTVASATATAGDLAVKTTGNLTVTNGSASGAIRLTSVNGGLTTTTLTPGTDLLLHAANDLLLGNLTVGGAIDLASTSGAINAGTIGAGGNVKAIAATNLGFTTVSGGALTLTATGGTLTGNGITAANGATLATGGALTIGTNVAVAGPLSVTGASVALTTPGALSLTNAVATNGGIALRSGGNLSLTQGSATGTLDLQSTSGAVIASGFSAGNVIARGTAVTLTATGPLAVANATATAGDLVIHDIGVLTLTAGSASGGVDLTGSGITIGTADAGGLFKAVATGNLGFTSVSGNTVQLTAQGGQQGNSITGGTLTAIGAATLLATDAVAIGTNFAAGAGSSVDGSAITLTSTGALALAHAGATNGTVTLRSGGDLTLAEGIAGGGIDIRSSNGIVNASGLVTGSAGVTAQGTSVTLSAPGSLKVAAALATAGDLDITATGDLVITTGSATGAVRAASLQGSLDGSVAAGGDLSLHSAAALTLGNLNGNGAIDLASSGGAISTGAIAAKGDVTVNAATDIAFSSMSGRTLSLSAASGMLVGDSISATNGATLAAGGVLAINTDIAIDGTFNVSGGSVALTATGPLGVTSAHADAGDLVIHAANGLTLGDGAATESVTLASSGGGLAIDTLTAGNGATLTAADAVTVTRDAAINGAFLVTGRSVSIQAANGLTLTNATATGGDLTLNALNGGITGAHLSATGAARLTAPGAILSGDIRAASGVIASGSSIDLTAPGALTLTSATASAGDLVAQAAGDLTLISGTAARSIGLTSTGGAIDVHDASVGGVQALRSLAAAAANVGDIAINAATTATMDGTISTSGAIAVTAASANVTGSVIGRTVGFATRGMAIGTGARIGQAGTTTAVTFTNSGTQRSVVGGTSGDNYLLTAAGLGRVQADAIILNLPAAADGSAANPDVTINDLTLHGSTGTATGTLANLTSIGGFTINTPGRVRVSGKLLLTDLAPTNSASILAGPEIDVVTPTGAILMTDSSGAPTGALTLAAQRIIVASQSALTDLASINGTDARSARLATNDGPVADQGYVGADHLTFRIASLLDVQNSGGSAAEARRGITAGAGGIDIAVTVPGTPEIILNGRQSTAAAFTSLIRVAAANGGFTPVLANGSSVNGCLVSTGCNTTPSTETLLSLILPQQDVVGMLDDGSSDDDDKKSKNGDKPKSGSDINRPLITIVKANPYGFGTIIDEPVTGAPNDDLWIDQPLVGVGNVTGDEPHH